MKGKGFTLIEAVVIIAVVTILAALIIPIVYKSVEQERYNRAEQDLKNIYLAIFGDGESSFGYHGDMGNLPPDLRCLAVPSGDSCNRPTPQEYPAGSGVIIGWKGPYFSPQRVDANGNFLDPWGNPYQMSPLSGASASWRLASAGPDGQINWTNSSDSVNQDNLYYPQSPLTVIDPDGDGLYVVANSVGLSSRIGKVENFLYTKFRVYYPVDGSGTYFESNYGATNLSNVPYGQRVFQGVVYTCNGDVAGKYYIKDVPFSGEVNIDMDLTNDVNGNLIDSVIWYQIINNPNRYIRIYARSNLNCSPVAGHYYQNGVSMEVVGIGSMSWNSSNGAWRYEIYLPSPPYNASSNTYTFTLYSSGGASLTVTN